MRPIYLVEGSDTEYYETFYGKGICAFKFYSEDTARKILKKIYTDDKSHHAIDSLPREKLADQFDFCFNTQGKPFPKGIINIDI